MSFNETTIKNISKLARLKFPADQEEKFTEDINSILNWVEELKEVNVDGIEPLISVSLQEPWMRKDEVTTGDLQQELLMNAPDAVHGFYAVPKMVE
ncbi:MAG: Asp-tRNA(Asn)/Glu-tRNA(Gln) amidotransferase subunit GatC [Alphaproteobacteria bacterium]|nr:Asp-tRNA(Asn)/Glu-tRNA(Gln) amidotransferase subunit GatC [Alphaproteobacteria bacterium]